MTGSPASALRAAYHKLVPVRIRRSLGALRRRCSFEISSFPVRLVDPNVRYMARRLSRLKDRYSGERCFIMGSGPSLNLMDLELFRNEHVWGVNKCYLLFDRVSWRPDHYVAVDTRVVPDISQEIGQMTAYLDDTTFFFPVQYRIRKVLPSRANVYWYRELLIDESRAPHRVFTRNAARWVSSVRTVTIAALQLAVYLGFDPIYLIGCDTSYSSRPASRSEAGHPERLVSLEDDDGSHFDPRYFGKGARWHEPRVDRMIHHYQWAKQVCDSLGVQVYNATVGGQLEVFPRVDYREVL